MPALAIMKEPVQPRPARPDDGEGKEIAEKEETV